MHANVMKSHIRIIRLGLGLDEPLSRQIQKRVTLTEQEEKILKIICDRFGWKEGKALHIMFVQWCKVNSLISETLHPHEETVAAVPR